MMAFLSPLLKAALQCFFIGGLDLVFQRIFVIVFLS